MDEPTYEPTDGLTNGHTLLLEKSELCNSLFEFRVSNRVFPFSLGHELASWVARGAAWALG